ncbi:hypothetical protein [Clavibacter sp. km1a]|uniref:hypothetical protein n=1 Tax=Clavibacter sp. km1a TaxID=3459136 RepID=UPI0040434F13
MSLTLERTAQDPRTAATSTAPAAAPIRSAEAPSASPLGGSYVTRVASTGREGTYVSSPAAMRRPRRGTYVTTPAAPAAVGSYTDTHGSARA